MTVTLYHRTGEGWERTVLPDVWARWSRGEAGGVMIPRDDGAESLLLIPWREGLALSLGDGVWDGEGPELTAGPLKAQLPIFSNPVALYRSRDVSGWLKNA